MKKQIVIPLILIGTILLIFSGCEEENTNSKPTVTITNPTSGAKIPVDTTITISIQAKDKDGKIKEISIYNNDSKIQTISALPYEYNWNTKNLSKGTHNLIASAIDDHGLTGEDTVQVSIGKMPDAGFKIGRASCRERVCHRV